MLGQENLLVRFIPIPFKVPQRAERDGKAIGTQCESYLTGFLLRLISTSVRSITFPDTDGLTSRIHDGFGGREPIAMLGAQAMGQDDRSANCHVVAKVIPALESLLQASVYAVDTDSQVWDFAISIRRLLEMGASETDLRWLVKKGFVEHGREVTVEGDNGREFRPTGNLTFSRQTCFVLTESGIKAARCRCNSSNNGHAISASSNGHGNLKLQVAKPQWDSESRKLQVDGQLVKRFKWPAVNQEAVLCAFEEEGWPERIDDPLAPQPEQDSKRRLADTIKCLNRKQTNPLIHFRGDGTGEGVVWERVENE